MNVRFFFHRQALVAAVLCPLIFYSMNRIEFAQPSLFTPSDYQLTPEFFKFVSVGFWPAASDLLWLQTLQRIGGGNYSRENLSETLDFYRLSSSLDPNFYEAYDQAAVVFGFFYEAPDPAIEMLDRGIKVYESGQAPPKFWTHPYSLYLHRAYVNAFLKNNWVQAKADYLKAAATPGSPPYLQNMKIWLTREGSERKLALRVLTLLAQNAKDPVIKSKYLEKLKKYE